MEVQQGSLVDRLRNEHVQSRSAEKSLILPVPGFEGISLWVKYTPIDWDALAEMLDADDATTPHEGLEQNLEALGDACDRILVRENGNEVSLADALREQGEEVHGEVKFDEYLVDVLDLQIKDPASGEKRAPKTRDETILALFAGAVSPELAVTEHAARLAVWMQGRNAAANAETLGKN